MPIFSWSNGDTLSSVRTKITNKLSQVIDVKSDFGATGDGSTDDTSNLQAALDAAFGTSGSPHDGATYLNRGVYLPPGNYRISQPLRVTKVNSGAIFGAGMYVSGLTWLGSGYNGNSFVINGANDSTPNANVSCMLELDGFSRCHVSDMFFNFGSALDKFTACWYAYGGLGGCHLNTINNVSFGGSTFGVLLGAISPLVSEWTFKGCEFGFIGTAGVALYGQNTLNHNFYSCAFSQVGQYPITSSFTASITSNVMTVTAFNSSTYKMPLSAGLRVYSDDGAVGGGCFITSLGTGTGGTGTYNVSSTPNVSSRTINAMYPNRAAILNISGSAPMIHGCSLDSNCPLGFYDSSSNPTSIIGTRSEGFQLAEFVGEQAHVQCCDSVRGTVTWTGTSTGPILHITALSGGFDVFPGMTVTANDGTNSLPTSGSAVEPATRIIKQITGTPGKEGDYLMTASATPGNLTSTTITGLSAFVYATGSSTVILDQCESRGGVIVGSNNAVIAIRMNGFATDGTPTSNLLDLYYGAITSFDLAESTGHIVANLPTARGSLKGVRMFVTDSDITASGNFYTSISGHGGGSNTVPVWCDGSAWRIG